MNSGKNLRVNERTRIKVLLEAKPEDVLRALVELNGNFKKLLNPVLRRLFAGRVTIADACKLAGCRVTDFMEKMRSIGFETTDNESAPKLTQEARLTAFRDDRILDFDARPVLDANQDPLNQIMQLANSLEAGQCLRVTATFSPTPLITLLARKGYTHATEVLSPDLVRTYFKRTSVMSEAGDAETVPPEVHDFDQVLASIKPHALKYVDVRELEMPQPMLTIMEHLEALPDDTCLFVYHKKVPLYFLPQLHHQGFKYHLKRTEDGQVNMIIYRA